MSLFENNLRKALREPQPPADMAERVLAVFAVPKKRKLFLIAHPVWSTAAAALAIALGVGGLQYQRERAERLENERAKEQVIQAFRLAAERLRPFRERLAEMQQTTPSIPEEK